MDLNELKVTYINSPLLLVPQRHLHIPNIGGDIHRSIPPLPAIAVPSAVEGISFPALYA